MNSEENNQCTYNTRLTLLDVLLISLLAVCLVYALTTYNRAPYL